ncbi:TPA: hypothetical protein ACIAE4_005519, partial [Escherichia coli]
NNALKISINYPAEYFLYEKHAVVRCLSSHHIWLCFCGAQMLCTDMPVAATMSDEKPAKHF